MRPASSCPAPGACQDTRRRAVPRRTHCPVNIHRLDPRGFQPLCLAQLTSFCRRKKPFPAVHGSSAAVTDSAGPAANSTQVPLRERLVPQMHPPAIRQMKKGEKNQKSVPYFAPFGRLLDGGRRSAGPCRGPARKLPAACAGNDLGTTIATVRLQAQKKTASMQNNGQSRRTPAWRTLSLCAALIGLAALALLGAMQFPAMARLARPPPSRQCDPPQP